MTTPTISFVPVTPGTGANIVTAKLANNNQLPISALATSDGTTVTPIDSTHALPVSDAGLVGVATNASLTETHFTAGAVKVERICLFDATGAQIAALPVTLASTTITGSVSVSNFPSTQVVSGTVAISSLPAITFATAQHVIVDSATLGTVTVSGAVTTSGTATVAQGTAGASPWPVSLTSTTITGTVAAAQSGTWSVGVNVALPAGGNTIGVVNQGTAGASPWLTSTTITGTVPLPTGAATSAAQTNAQTSLSSIDTKTPAQGQALAASSSPVVLPALQAAALAQESGGNLATLVARQPALGPAMASGGSPVVSAIASHDTQATLPTAGKSLKTGPGTALLCVSSNTTGGAVFLQIHDSLSSPIAGTQATWFAPASIANAANSSTTIGHGTYGAAVATGLFFVLSSTQATYTAIASTAFAYTIYYL